MAARVTPVLLPPLRRSKMIVVVAWPAAECITLLRLAVTILWDDVD
jgi:hypothetical protein